jgi:hypothetical protein
MIFSLSFNEIKCQSANETMTRYINQSMFGDFNSKNLSHFQPNQNMDELVDKFRGRPNVNIPIYTIKFDNQEFPIYLKYNTNGIKVEEIASWIGLGWDINMPGVIKRNVQGLPDEVPFNGYLGAGGSELFDLFKEGGLEDDIYDQHFVDSEYWDGYQIPKGVPGGAKVWSFNSEGEESNDDAFYDLMLVADNQMDGMPDEFYYSTINNTGKFIFDRKGIIQAIPKTNFQIIFENPDNNWETSRFIIVDDKGISYIYDDRNISNNKDRFTIRNERDYNPSNFITSRKDQLYESPLTEDYVTAWNLSKIILPNKQEIQFNYHEEEISYFSNSTEYFFRSYTQQYNGTGDPTLNLVHRTMSFINETVNFIESIVWDEGHIDFQRSTHKREDVDHDPYTNKSGYPLKSISIYTINNELLKKYVLIQSYYKTVDDSYYNDAFRKRLMLDAILVISNDGNSIPPYQFDYNKGYFPSRLSHKKDLWGYYKSTTQVGDNYYSKPNYYLYPDDAGNERFNSINSIYPRSDYAGSSYLIDDGYDMTPDCNNLKQLMLNKITYPSGSWDYFEYDCNKFRYGGEDRVGPGLRVSRIERGSPIFGSTDKITSLNYIYTDTDTTSGCISALPHIFRFDKGLFANNTDVNYIDKLVGATIRYSTVQNQKDTEIGYKKVTVKYCDEDCSVSKGKAIYYYDFSGNSFLIEDDYNDELGEYLYKKAKTMMWIEDDVSGYWPLDDNWNFYTGVNEIKDTHASLLNPDYNWNRGSLIRKEIYDDDGNPREIIDYEYSVDEDITRVFGINAYNYFTHVFTENDIVGVLILPGGITINIYGVNNGYLMIRWGAQEYISARKYLKKKTTTSFLDNENIVSTLEYTYNDKNKISSVKSDIVDNEYIEDHFKYATDFVVTDCYENYREDLRLAYENYIDNLETECEQYDDPSNPTLFAQLYPCYIDEFNQYINNVNLLKSSYDQCKLQQTSNSDIGATAIMQLAANNRVELIEEQKHLLKNNERKVISSYLTKYKKLENNIIEPVSYLNFETDETNVTPFETYIDNNEELVIDEHYKEKLAIQLFDLKGDVLQSQRKDDIPNSFVYGHNTSQLLAQVSNATYNDIAYTSFESSQKEGNWSFYQTNILCGSEFDPVTGECIFSSLADPNHKIIWSVNELNGHYEVTFWCKTNATSAEPFIWGNGISTISHEIIDDDSGGDWKLHKIHFVITDSQIGVYPPTGATYCYIDELRLYPIDAMMTSVTVKPQIGVTSITDMNGVTTYKTYDGFGQLNLIKNTDKNIVSSHSYNYSTKYHDNYIYFSQDHFNVDLTGGLFDLEIYTLLGWTLDSYPNWVTVSNTQGNNADKISIDIESNNTVNPRSGKLIFSSGNISEEIDVSQQPNNTLYLNVNAPNQTFDWDDYDETLLINVYSNISNITVTEDSDWFSISPVIGQNNFNITVTCTSNNLNGPPTLIEPVVISGGGITKTITILQRWQHMAQY